MTSSDDAITDESTVAAVDLGSNSFHMVVARTTDSQLHIVDRLKESVRLAAGLDEQQNLTTEACERALACLERFGQRLLLLPPARVKAVGTNTLRRMKHSSAFLEAAETALGHPIEIIYGLEEARLIYAGVTLDLGEDRPRRFVVDIGGGSTELIIGNRTEPQLLESLSLGAVSHSQKYFPNGAISKSAWHDGVVGARLQLRPTARSYRSTGWDLALGASGSIKSIQQVCEASGWSEHTITPHALHKLGKKLVESKHVDAADLPKLSDDRRPIFPGAVAILTAIFESLDVDEMAVSDKALREGLLLDLIGRDKNRDIREASVVAMQRRYGVDSDHAERVATTARKLLRDVSAEVSDARGSGRLLHWAALLHEIGLAIAYKGYHKHGSYIVSNADLQGFSQSEQAVLAALLYLQRGKFRRTIVADLPATRQTNIELLALLLRLAVLLHRGRDPKMLAPACIAIDGKNLELTFDNNWLEDHPLTRADLRREQRHLDAAGYVLEINT